jgi:four helix bundle protein
VGNVNSFEDLTCYQNCKRLRIKVRSLVNQFDQTEKFRLSDQMIRCSRSITNNIAEGYGRFHFKENAQFCRQSRGSLFEMLDHLSIAFEEKYINEIELNELEIEINECIKVLNGYIKYLVNANNNQ